MGHIPVSRLLRTWELLGTSRTSPVSNCLTALISSCHDNTSELHQIVVSGGRETTMGMEFGSKGSSMATMNVVPLIDILLVLIIIFMVITPLTPKGLEALIPQPAKADTPNAGPIAKTIVVR